MFEMIFIILFTLIGSVVGFPNGAGTCNAKALGINDIGGMHGRGFEINNTTAITITTSVNVNLITITVSSIEPILGFLIVARQNQIGKGNFFPFFDQKTLPCGGSARAAITHRQTLSSRSLVVRYVISSQFVGSVFPFDDIEFSTLLLVGQPLSSTNARSQLQTFHQNKVVVTQPMTTTKPPPAPYTGTDENYYTTTRDLYAYRTTGSLWSPPLTTAAAAPTGTLSQAEDNCQGLSPASICTATVSAQNGLFCSYFDVLELCVRNVTTCGQCLRAQNGVCAPCSGASCRDSTCSGSPCTSVLSGWNENVCERYSGDGLCGPNAACITDVISLSATERRAICDTGVRRDAAKTCASFGCRRADKCQSGSVVDAGKLDGFCTTSGRGNCMTGERCDSAGDCVLASICDNVDRESDCSLVYSNINNYPCVGSSSECRSSGRVIPNIAPPSQHGCAGIAGKGNCEAATCTSNRLRCTWVDFRPSASTAGICVCPKNCHSCSVANNGRCEYACTTESGACSSCPRASCFSPIGSSDIVMFGPDRFGTCQCRGPRVIGCPDGSVCDAIGKCARATTCHTVTDESLCSQIPCGWDASTCVWRDGNCTCANAAPAADRLRTLQAAVPTYVPSVRFSAVACNGVNCPPLAVSEPVSLSSPQSCPVPSVDVSALVCRSSTGAMRIVLHEPAGVTAVSLLVKNERRFFYGTTKLVVWVQHGGVAKPHKSVDLSFPVESTVWVTVQFIRANTRQIWIVGQSWSMKIGALIVHGYSTPQQSVTTDWSPSNLGTVNSNLSNDTYIIWDSASSPTTQPVTPVSTLQSSTTDAAKSSSTTSISQTAPPFLTTTPADPRGAATTSTTKKTTPAQTTLNSQQIVDQPPMSPASFLDEYWWVLAAAGGGVCLILSIVIAVAVCRSRGDKEQDDEEAMQMRANALTEMHSFRAPSTTTLLSGGTTSELTNWQINADELQRGKQIGQGAFGAVFVGKWRDMKVAIKQVHGELADDEAFLEEAERMRRLQPHQNVVTFCGTTNLDGRLAVVLQYCSGGSLLDTLYGSKPLKWSEKELLQVARGSAAGIVHLHGEKIVHRDIAARNVLLDRNKMAKITDFGMSRDTTGSNPNESNVTYTTVGPLKWMAPESIESQKYSYASDVFSFGVLLFEIFEQQVPWQGKNGPVAAAAVLGGKRMQLSTKTPSSMSQLMQQCWNESANARPLMRDVLAAIAQAQGKDGLNNDDFTTLRGHQQQGYDTWQQQYQQQTPQFDNYDEPPPPPPFAPPNQVDGDSRYEQYTPVNETHYSNVNEVI